MAKDGAVAANSSDACFIIKSGQWPVVSGQFVACPPTCDVQMMSNYGALDIEASRDESFQPENENN
jgi:hypothetical protein